MSSWKDRQVKILRSYIRLPGFEWPQPTCPGNPMHEHFPNWHIEVTISLKNATETYGDLDTTDKLLHFNWLIRREL